MADPLEEMRESYWAFREELIEKCAKTEVKMNQNCKTLSDMQKHKANCEQTTIPQMRTTMNKILGGLKVAGVVFSIACIVVISTVNGSNSKADKATVKAEDASDAVALIQQDITYIKEDMKEHKDILKQILKRLE